MKKNIKVNIIGVSLLCIIFLGFFSTISIATGNYNIALTKGTEVFTVTHYNEVAWKNIVNSSTTPANWFEGDSNQTGARSKNTIKGWNYITWETYDVIVSLFLPMLFENEELIPLLGLLNSQGYNETTININYTNNYNLWVGLRATWNFTIGSFEEDPSNANDAILLFKNPMDINDILNDYNNLSTKLNNNLLISMSNYTFPILDSDEFLWLFMFNGLALGTPLDSYLEVLITSLNCQNAAVNSNILTISRIGEANYTVEITYGVEGTMSSFIVKDINNNLIYRIVATNSDLIFYTIIIILIICFGGLIAYLIFWKRKVNRKRNK